MKRIICEKCGVTVEKDIVALNKKLLSKHTKEFFCINCLATFLDSNVEALQDKIEQFKEEGCTLFL